MTEPGITTAIDGAECVLTVVGEIDLTSAQKVTDLGVGALQTDAIRLLVVDLSAVTYIDSTELGALVRMRHEATIQGKLFSIRNPSAAVWTSLRITALDTVLPIEKPDETSDDASEDDLAESVLET